LVRAQTDGLIIFLGVESLCFVGVEAKRGIGVGGIASSRFVVGQWFSHGWLS